MKGFLRTADICRRLGICDETWTRWVKSGAVEPHNPNLPGAKKWSVEYIERLAQGEVAPSGQGRRYFGAHRRSA